MTPVALNNWALCRYLAGDYQDALALLAPLLVGDELAPFSHALASRAWTARGERERARDQLREAVRDFDRGLGQCDLGWVEYTSLIKRAAGEFGDHRLVLDLHGRWPGRDLATGAFYAGVAAFNLRKFAQAAKYWRRISDRGWPRLMEAYARVADLAEQGVVPPFALEYEPSGESVQEERSPSAVQALAEKGAVRSVYLLLLSKPQLPTRP